MTYEQFFHVLRASITLSKTDKLIVFGSNAVLYHLHLMGYEDARMLYEDEKEISRELDISTAVENLDMLIDSSIGELSMFDSTFSYYAHGTGIEGFKAPRSWEKRAATLELGEFPKTKIIIPSLRDLIVAKLAAGRQKDIKFVKNAMSFFNISRESIEPLTKEAMKDHPDYREILKLSLGLAGGEATECGCTWQSKPSV